MEILDTKLEGVKIIECKKFSDNRGYFLESWNIERFGAAGLPTAFRQDNLSCSHKNVLRGLHFQNPNPQGKLVSVFRGAVFDVAVDLRRSSKTFGQWVGVELSAENGRQLYVPEGFAHGFVTLTDDVLFFYKCTENYRPGTEHCLLWNDPKIGIEWPCKDPVISTKDAVGKPLAELSEVLFP